ncbi:MAG TPA: peptidogalycan biosysnthesis protein [Nevskiaceae bacterium]|nr:peptidogalycan biosysnthesis protein [Nevskiaceae bacterium]
MRPTPAAALGHAALDATVWDGAFAGDYPFVRHRFLAALETSGSVGSDSGWEPWPLLETSGAQPLAAPAYLKHHSYGEFVFDFSWAQASAQLGRPYYPKLVVAIPFVPSTGPRLGAADDDQAARLVAHLQARVARERLGSAHALFLDERDDAVLGRAGWLAREDLQFRWFRRGARDWEDWLARLSSERRKKIRRERRRVSEAGIRFEVRRGDELDEAAWAEVYALYAHTYAQRGQEPYLTPAFWLHYGRAAGTPVRLILGLEGRRRVCVALTVQAGRVLYGRHWGAAEHYHSLHFECCYYQGIELCLREGLDEFDAGTQGEHKLWRGFDPVRTRSRHWLAPGPLREAVADYLQRERAAIAQRHAALQTHTPWRQAP